MGRPGCKVGRGECPVLRRGECAPGPTLEGGVSWGSGAPSAGSLSREQVDDSVETENERAASGYRAGMRIWLAVAALGVGALILGPDNVEDLFQQPPGSTYRDASPTEPGLEPTGIDDGPEFACVDVTSHDHDWNNDMLCTRSDGSEFHTSYEGAREFEALD